MIETTLRDRRACRAPQSTPGGTGAHALREERGGPRVNAVL